MNGAGYQKQASALPTLRGFCHDDRKDKAADSVLASSAWCSTADPHSKEVLILLTLVAPGPLGLGTFSGHRTCKVHTQVGQ
jgi:hypothetical protein